MSTIDAPVDVDVLRSEIQKTYTEVSIEQEREFMFPTGRAWAEELGYPQPELSRVPDGSVDSFAGVANHFLLGRLDSGETVVDLGCGSGTDLLIAAQMVGPEGRAIGIDMTASMSVTIVTTIPARVGSGLRFQTIVGIPARIALVAIPWPIAPMPSMATGSCVGAIATSRGHSAQEIPKDHVVVARRKC